MTTESRTSKSIRNVKVALLFYLLNLVLQFFSRKIFLDYLGSEILGLNTTANNLLSFLNLAELGIGSAVAYNLYKPLFDQDRVAIHAIVSLQGWLYRRIAYIVIAGSCILMCFFPMIFAKAQVPLGYAYGSFIALLIASLLSYFVNYRQIVLSADQKEYKITFAVQGGRVVKLFLQILAIRFLDHGYIWWMILEVVMALVTSYALDRAVKTEYPWLKPVIREGKRLQKQYPGIITKTKQVFFHKIGYFVLSQTSPLIIYAYASLSLVAIYGNYMLIIFGVTLLMNSLMNSINAGVGNLVAEGDKTKIKALFWEITIFRMWIASVICFGMYVLGDSFVTLWVGKDYLLPPSAFIIMIINTFITLSRTNDTFLYAYGLFQDTWAPIAEAILNLGLSIVFGYYWGLTGILSGVLISQVVIVYCWKPYFLYKEGFKERITEYILRYAKYLLLLVGTFLVSWQAINHFITLSPTTYLKWLVYGLCALSVYCLLSALLLYHTDREAREICYRLVRTLKNFLNRK